MDKQNLMPQAAQPVNRSTTGQLPESLAELSEEALQQHGTAAVSASLNLVPNHTVGGLPLSMICVLCSYDGDDAE